MQKSNTSLRIAITQKDCTFHFHFISYDKTFGGHLVSGTLSSAKIKISIDEKPGYEIVLPQQNKNFDKPWPQQQVKSSY
ncbi:acetolactate decarboxylase [Flavobacterium sp. CLA17]|uniref:acetolactate decarboxylase n=1 Tax=Flavobacterium sp. CLA17 TaxID=2724135 RepID=UPI00351AD147